MSKLNIVEGQRFGRLTVIKRNGTDNFRLIMWQCKCDCGNIVNVRSSLLIKGYTQSCGCLQREATSRAKTIHGQSKSRLYNIYNGMKARCYDKNDHCYKFYGAKGIKICDEWKNDFRLFYDWATKNGYDKNLTIERKDVYGNYCPENCSWITMSQQQFNKRNTVYITYNGKTLNMKEWEIETGIPRKTIHQRYYDGWDVEKMLTQKREIHIYGKK